jgi:hypothetical protein
MSASAEGTKTAEAAVAVVVAYHILSAGRQDGQADDSVTQDSAAVHQRLADLLGPDSPLEALHEQPTSDTRREALAAAIAARLESDPELAPELTQLVQKAAESTAVRQTILTTYGYDQATALGIG